MVLYRNEGTCEKVPWLGIFEHECEIVRDGRRHEAACFTVGIFNLEDISERIGS